MTQPIQIRDLCCRRGAFALGPLSFDVPAGGRFAVVGPSGSGKTTLLRCLAGLERAAGGRIAVGDRQVADAAARVHLPPDRRKLGLVFQDGALWPHLTALQHLAFAAPGLGRDAAVALLERAGIGHLRDRRPAAMSGGEAQRLGLVRALAPAPEVLLLDEPLRSVDVHQRDALALLVRTLADERGITTVLVTHDRDEALALATDLVVLHAGRLVEQGPAPALLAAPRTAFTAAFLAGAACLPTSPAADGVDTPFGRFPRPGTSARELRLVLLPGDVHAAPHHNGAPGPRGRVLAALPAGHGATLRVAFGDQIVLASAADLLPAGTDVQLSLPDAPRLLPWHGEETAS